MNESMNSMIAGALTPIQQAMIPSVLSGLDDEISRLEERIEFLAQRISATLLPAMPKTSPSEKNQEIQTSEIAAYIKSKTGRIMRLRYQVNSLIERCEL